MGKQAWWRLQSFHVYVIDHRLLQEGMVASLWRQWHKYSSALHFQPHGTTNLRAGNVSGSSRARGSAAFELSVLSRPDRGNKSLNNAEYSFRQRGFSTWDINQDQDLLPFLWNESYWWNVLVQKHFWSFNGLQKKWRTCDRHSFSRF